MLGKEVKRVRSKLVARAARDVGKLQELPGRLICLAAVFPVDALQLGDWVESGRLVEERLRAGDLDVGVLSQEADANHAGDGHDDLEERAKPSPAPVDEVLPRERPNVPCV